jgi:glycosyltransferase involved in cell wall biosynthesis
MPQTEEIVVSIVVPIYNEEQTIPELYDRLKKAALQISENYEIIFVNDGSRDQSLQALMAVAARDHRVRYIAFSRNFGHQIAVTAGLDHAHGAAVAIIDGDLQDPPEIIPELYSKHKEGFEVVYARRNKREGESYFKKITAKWFYRIIKKLTNFDIPVDVGDFRLVDRKIVDLLKRMPEQNKFLRGQNCLAGIPPDLCDVQPRQAEVRHDGLSVQQNAAFCFGRYHFVFGSTSAIRYPRRSDRVGFIIGDHSLRGLFPLLPAAYHHRLDIADHQLDVHWRHSIAFYWSNW